MIASVHVSDVSLSVALSAARRTSFHRSVDGLRHANLAFAAPLSPSVLPRPSLRRIVMVAIWDGDAALDRFLETDRFANLFQNGWQVRLQPLRADPRPAPSATCCQLLSDERESRGPDP